MHRLDFHKKTPHGLCDPIACKLYRAHVRVKDRKPYIDCDALGESDFFIHHRICTIQVVRAMQLEILRAPVKRYGDSALIGLWSGVLLHTESVLQFEARAPIIN